MSLSLFGFRHSRVGERKQALRVRRFSSTRVQPLRNLDRGVTLDRGVLATPPQPGGPMRRTSYSPDLASPPAPLATHSPRNPEAIQQAVDELLGSYGWLPGIPKRLG